MTPREHLRGRLPENEVSVTHLSHTGMEIEMKNLKKWVSLLLTTTIVMTSTVGVFAKDTDTSDTTEAATSETTTDAATSSDAADDTTTDAASSETTDENQKTTDNSKVEGNVSTDDSSKVEGNISTDDGSSKSTETETQSASTETGEGDKVEIKKNDKPYLALGADLTEAQKNTVLSLMGIDPAALDQYDVVTVTNQEEHQYLDQYISSSAIGTKSLSSVVIVQRDKGNGLNVSTNNINYCTVGMYKNALTTAGITDADIIVAGPCNLSGTAALVGIFKAYTEMTGETIQDDVVDTALNELVITGQLEDSIDGLTNEQVEEFIAYVKTLIAQNDIKDEASINDAIDQACEKYGVTLSDEDRQQIVDFVLKLIASGVDLNKLADYASSLYNSFKGGNTDVSGVFQSIGNFFSDVFTKIGDFFKNLFS